MSLFDKILEKINKKEKEHCRGSTNIYILFEDETNRQFYLRGRKVAKNEAWFEVLACDNQFNQKYSLFETLLSFDLTIPQTCTILDKLSDILFKKV